MLNVALMKEPLNWIIILLMVLLGSMAVRYIMASSATAQDDN